MTIRIADKIIAGSVNTTEIKSYIDGEVNKLPYVPTGTILPFGGTTAPDGFLICDGSAISRTTYSKLFATIGTAYGAGDGNSTFNIPNYNDRVPQGGIAGYKEAGLPNLKYQFRNASGNGEYGTAQILTDNGSNGKTITLSSGYIYSDGINIVGNSTTVQPPACLSKFIIKY